MSSIRVAMLGQGYTPITSAPVCGNCRHRVATEPGQGRGRSCELGGFFVSACGTCDKHQAMSTFGAAKVEAQGDAA